MPISHMLSAKSFCAIDPSILGLVYLGIKRAGKQNNIVALILILVYISLFFSLILSPLCYSRLSVSCLVLGH